jgi:beta-phosphoglucomutase-like phosphatase (HAD superfamily)
MIAFIDAHREVYGAEPISRMLPIAPSTYHEHFARRTAPDRLPPRVKRGTKLWLEIHRVWDENFQVYGVRKVWRQLCRQGIGIACCTTARLMKQMGLAGVLRGKVAKTTVSNPATPDRVTR